MFNWLFKKDKIQPESQTVNELGSINYSITLDQGLACTVNIKTFNKMSANCFAQLLVLLEQGEVIHMTIQTLQTLYENNITEQTQFVDQALEHWQSESNKIMQPFIKPTDVFKEK